jgi:hypothetical protein
MVLMMFRMNTCFSSSANTVALSSTRFRHPLLVNDLQSVRGLRCYVTERTFKWSLAVRALALLLVRHALINRKRPRLVAVFIPSRDFQVDVTVDGRPVEDSHTLHSLVALLGGS